MKQVIQDYNKILWDVAMQYDTTNSNILRKIIHSYDVATNSFKIACTLKLNEKDRQFAYLIGILHDIGRFEQWKLYQTYDDRRSIDHADLSYSILKEWDYNKLFNLNKQRYNILLNCIKYHNKPYKGNNKKIILFNEILRNADTFSNVITVANGAQQMMNFTKNGFTPEIYNKFVNLQPLVGCLLNTKLDRCLALTSTSYNITYDFLRQEIIDNNYIDIMHETFSKYLSKSDKLIYKQAIYELKRKYIVKNKKD